MHNFETKVLKNWLGRGKPPTQTPLPMEWKLPLPIPNPIPHHLGASPRMQFWVHECLLTIRLQCAKVQESEARIHGWMTKI